MEANLKVPNHPGPLNKIIRQYYEETINGEHQPTRKYMANVCEVTNDMIGMFERGVRGLEPDSFDRYLQALPLKMLHRRLLMNMYRSYWHRPKLEEHLAYYDYEVFSLTRVKFAHPTFADILYQARRQHHPYLVVDELFSVHAIDPRLLNLMGMHNHHLQDRLSWHSLCPKYLQNSPIRLAHLENTPYRTHLVQNIFVPGISPYFFTAQCQDVLSCLMKLSPDEFAVDLYSVLHSLGTPLFPHQDVSRHILYENVETIWHVAPALAHPIQVRIPNGPVLKFQLIYFIPEGKD